MRRVAITRRFMWTISRSFSKTRYNKYALAAVCAKTYQSSNACLSRLSFAALVPYLPPKGLLKVQLPGNSLALASTLLTRN